MAQRDPIERHGSEDEPVVTPSGARHRTLLEFPRQRSAETISIWRTVFYFLLLVIALSAITYLIVRPR